MLRVKLCYRHAKMGVRPPVILTSAYKEVILSFAKAMLGLKCLGLNFIFINDYRINESMVNRYKWVPKVSKGSII